MKESKQFVLIAHPYVPAGEYATLDRAKEAARKRGLFAYVVLVNGFQVYKEGAGVREPA